MPGRRRLDAELVRRGLATSRAQALNLIESGRVRVAGAPAEKAARLVGPAEPLTLVGDRPRYVGRGGQKLEAALAGFRIDVSGRRALDAGASTGGFTDCLLQHGAARVTAVDVGRAQLHERLRRDERVEVKERTDIRHAVFDEQFGVAVADLSFISLSHVAEAIAEAVRPGGDLLVLVKPQFEVGKREASKGKGVITDPALWRAALLRAIAAFKGAGAAMMGAMVSPLHGADGNVEFFLHLRMDTGGLDQSGAEAAVDEAVRQANGTAA